MMNVANAIKPREDKEVHNTNQQKHREPIQAHQKDVSQLLSDLNACKEISVRIASQLQQLHH
jgi:hypothetical protein